MKMENKEKRIDEFENASFDREDDLMNEDFDKNFEIEGQESLIKNNGVFNTQNKKRSRPLQNIYDDESVDQGNFINIFIVTKIGNSDRKTKYTRDVEVEMPIFEDESSERNDEFPTKKVTERKKSQEELEEEFKSDFEESENQGIRESIKESIWKGV